MSTNYSIGALGYPNYMSDQYFLQALNSYNPNFKRSSNVQNVSSQNEQSLEALKQYQQQESGNQSVNMPATQLEEESSGNGLLVGGAIAAAAAAGACIIASKRGNGKVIEGFKNIFKGIKGTSSKAEKAANSATDRLTVIMGNGKLQYLIPEQRTEVMNNVAKINEFAAEHGIDINSKKIFNENSVLHKLKVKNNNTNYTVIFENGDIKSIMDTTGKGKNNGKELSEIIKNAKGNEKEKLEKFSEQIVKIREELAKGKDFDKDILNNVTNIEYTNTSGDEIMKMLMENINKEATIKEFSTLKRFDINAPELRAYVPQTEAEKALINPDFIENRKLVDGLTLGRHEYTTNDSTTTYLFNGREIVGIKQNGQELKVGSFGYNQWMAEKANTNIWDKIRSFFSGQEYTNEEAAKKYLEKLFEGKIEIPEGATVIAA